MSSGPIEFLGDDEAHDVPATEFGGADGLIQPSPTEVGTLAYDGMPLGHELEPSEIGNVMRRAAGVEPTVTARNEGELDAVPVVDPVSGRVLGPDEPVQDVTGKWGRDHALGEGRIQ